MRLQSHAPPNTFLDLFQYISNMLVPTNSLLKFKLTEVFMIRTKENGFIQHNILPSRLFRFKDLSENVSLLKYLQILALFEYLLLLLPIFVCKSDSC